MSAMILSCLEDLASQWFSSTFGSYHISALSSIFQSLVERKYERDLKFIAEYFMDSYFPCFD